MLRKTFLLILVLVLVVELAKAASDCERRRKKAKRSQKKGMLGEMIYECEEDGSYKRKQCPASTGLCYCVDPETGDRISDYSRDDNFSCQESISDCEHQREKAKRSQQNGMLGEMIYECEEDGSYKRKQCPVSTGLCYCVDPETGERISDYSREENFSCQESTLSDCQRQREKAKRSQQNGMLGEMIYECEEDGSYKKKQCPASTGLCYCVDPETGERISDYSREENFSCQESVSDCEERREKAKRSQQNGMLGELIYECEEDGSYKKKQCRASTGFCHCVEPETGKRISNYSNKPDFSCE